MLVNYLGANGQVRCVGVDSLEVLKNAARIHSTSNVATAAFGRTLTGALILTRHLKNKDDILTLQIRGDGPLGGVVAVTTSDCKVRGYVINPDVTLPLKDGKLDVGGAIGKGNITVVKDFGLKEPYVGSVPLLTGEIAEDLAYYLAVSEQIPSLISLGVLVKGNEVLASGGFMIQPLPNTDEEIIVELEKRSMSFPPVSQLLYAGATIDDVLNDFMRGFSMERLEEVETSYARNCSRDRIIGVIASLGKDGLAEIIEDDEGAEVKCHFCNTAYYFNTDELKKINDELE